VVSVAPWLLGAPWSFVGPPDVPFDVVENSSAFSTDTPFAFRTGNPYPSLPACFTHGPEACKHLSSLL